MRKALVRGEKQHEGELLRKQIESYVSLEKSQVKQKSEKAKDEIKSYIAQHQRLKKIEQELEKESQIIEDMSMIQYAHRPFDMEQKRYRDKFLRFNERARHIQNMSKEKKNLSVVKAERDSSLDDLIRHQELEKSRLAAK